MYVQCIKNYSIIIRIDFTETNPTTRGNTREFILIGKFTET